MPSLPVQKALHTVLVGMVVNALLAAIKIAVGFIGHSYALIADGIESLNDLIASTALLVSLRIAAKPADADHPYGHGRAEQLGALFAALSLLAAGGLIAVQSTRNLFERHTSPAWFTLPTLLVVIVVKEWLSRYALKKSAETLSTALQGDAWHHRADAITSAAAVIGISVALLGGPGYEKADDIAALLGVSVIAFNGIRLLRTALHETMDGAPSVELQREVRALAASVRHVRRIEKLRMKKSGLGYQMDIHVQVDPAMTVEQGHAVSHDVKDTLLQAGKRIQDVVVHLEPHVDPDAGAGSKRS